MNKYEFEYMMLDRLRTDCEYFLGWGNRNTEKLWAKSVDDQIAEMKRLWNLLPVKPEWLSMEDILKLENQMNSHGEKLQVGALVKIVNCREAEIYNGDIFKVISEPYEVCGSIVVKINCDRTGKYFGGGFDVTKLEIVE